MGCEPIFDKMKVLSSIVAMAAAQWDGFNDYSDLEKNQASPVSVYDVLSGQNQGSAGVGVVSADFTTAPNNVMGNGRKCWFCNARSVRDCFGSNTFSICQGQEYFCFYHERRKISHFFNRREKYIDQIRSTNGDAFYGSSGATVGSTYLPTSRRNAREGLCRVGKDWTYYSGHKWIYDGDADDAASTGSITLANQRTAERANGHQFYHERESWYNGMRPNGFMQEFHGGKGTESVCHFCCNPATTDGNFCNRRLLDGSATSTSSDGVFTFSDTTGSWYDAAGSTAVNAAIRADDDTHTYAGTPLQGGFDTSSKWLMRWLHQNGLLVWPVLCHRYRNG